MTLISNCYWERWAYLYDAPNTLEPFRLLYCQYSKRHNQLPKNVVPSNVSSKLEIPVANDENCDLSISLPKYLYSKMEGIQREYEHGLYSQHPSKSSHFLNCTLELSSLDNVSEHRLAKHDNDISLSKQYAHLNDLHYVNCSYFLTWCKDNKFIETKSNRNKLRGFNL